jgi:phosphoribosylformylglycinamidine synthase
MAPLFAEELGLVLEVAPQDVATVTSLFAQAGAPCAVVGRSRADAQCEVKVAGSPAVQGKTADLRASWESTAFALERLQAAEECVAAEQAAQASRSAPRWKIPYPLRFTPADKLSAGADRVRVAVVREEGSNGDREMSAAVYAAGMEPWDVTMSDLIDGRASLSSFRGVVFVGGFSYADVLDSAKGWAGTIRFNDRVLEQFKAFYDRPDTFSLGVCNGCQLMALLGWVPATGGSGDAGGASNGGASKTLTTAAQQLPDARQPRFVHNASGRFESRWVQVSVSDDTPAVMLRGMGGASIGVWCAHGEGQALFPDAAVREHVLKSGLAPIRYVDPGSSKTTEQYPFNPNGSPEGVAALCSADGRHLAMMPHPERCFLAWQLPWSPPELGLDPYGPGPWLKLFQNAREWAEKTAPKKAR